MKLIFEKSKPVAVRAPAELRASCRRGSRGAGASEGAAPAGDLRAGARAPLHRTRRSQLRRRHRLLPARLVHDEAQPAGQRARRQPAGLPRPAPMSGGMASQGALELMWRLQEILAEVCGLHAVSLQPAAGSQGELTGLMLMRAYFADRGESSSGASSSPPTRRTGRTPPASRWPASSSRRWERTSGGTSISTTCGRRSTSARRAHAHEPVDARPLRRAHRGGLRHLPRRRRAPVLRRREPERSLRDLASRRHGVRHRPHQPAQDVLAAARRRRAGRRADRGRDILEPFLPVRRCATARRSAWITTGRRRSARSVASAGRSASSYARTPSSAPTAPRSARCPRSPS